MTLLRLTREEYLQGQLNEANQKIGAQNEQIKNLQAQNANNESTIRTLQQQFEAFKQAQEKNNATLTNEKNEAQMGK